MSLDFVNIRCPRPLDSVIKVQHLRESERGRWDAFAESFSGATFFHLAGWAEVIKRTFGYPTYFLYAESLGRIRGILPMGHIRSRLFGNALISTPFCVYGGIAAKDEEAAGALEDAARSLANRLGVDYLELRQPKPRRSGAPQKSIYVTFHKNIAPEPEANLRAIPRKQRAMVRKGIQAGLHSEIDNDIDRFYRVYSESVRNLGTPVLPLKWFHTVREVFGDACEVLTVTKDGRPVASVMSYYFRNEVLPYYGGGTADARRLRGNDFMYWELMRRACERGVKVFDYGRSKIGTGSYDFKRNWGFEPEPLHYEYHLIRARQVPDINPLNPKYRLMVNIWRHMPVVLSRTLGPSIAKYLA